MLLQGIDNIETIDSLLRGKRLGLVTNPTGLDRSLRMTVDIVRKKYSLVCLFAPEHGIYGDKQAGARVGFDIDVRTGIPVQSLFGGQADLSGIDCLLYDIQDVGLRFYTYIYVMRDAMKACAARGIPFVVLDRCDPLGLTAVEGPVISPEYDSGVGGCGLPARYALTPGELARFINADCGCELTVVPCAGLTRDMLFSDTDLNWVQPSPNIPTFSAAVCYAGTVLFEGTNLSEGRGTTKPFEMIGAPWLDGEGLLRALRARDLPGVQFRSVFFTPTFSKHAGALCSGVQLFVRDAAAFRPFECGLEMLNIIRSCHDELEFISSDPKKQRFFIDLLAGTDAVRKGTYTEADHADRRADFISKVEKIRLY